MGYTIKIPNGFISMCNTDFNCPSCKQIHSEEDYYKQLIKSKHGVIHKKCKSCKTWLGITFDIRGDIRVWLKQSELKLK